MSVWLCLSCAGECVSGFGGGVSVSMLLALAGAGGSVCLRRGRVCVAGVSDRQRMLLWRCRVVMSVAAACVSMYVWAGLVHSCSC